MSRPYQQIVHIIQDRIQAGQYNPSDRLPTEHELADEFIVSRGTIRRALKILTDSKLIEQRHGVGSFVRSGDGTTTTFRRPVGRIAFVIPHLPHKHSIDTHILRGIERATFLAGRELHFVNLDDDSSRVDVLIHQWRGNRPDGVVFRPMVAKDYLESNRRILDRFMADGIPVVVVDTPVADHGIIRGNFVGGDGYRATRLLVRHLIDEGYRRFASIRVFDGVYTADQRFQGMRDELLAAGLPFEPDAHLVIRDVELVEQGRGEIRRLMASPLPYDAVLCSYDRLACNVADELRRMGRDIPGELALAGFDDTFAELMGITSVRQPYEEIGRRAVEMLLANRADGSVRQEFLPCELVVRDSSRRRELSGILAEA